MKRVDHSYGRRKSGESQDIEIDLWFCMVQYGSFLAREIVPVAAASPNLKTHQGQMVQVRILCTEDHATTSLMRPSPGLVTTDAYKNHSQNCPTMTIAVPTPVLVERQ